LVNQVENQSLQSMVALVPGMAPVPDPEVVLGMVPLPGDKQTETQPPGGAPDPPF